MLMPALYHMSLCAGPVIRPLLTNRYKITSSVATFVTNLLPPGVSSFLLRLQRHADSVAHVSRQVINGSQRSLYENVCVLGNEEKGCIQKPEYVEFEKSVLIWARGDRWCPVEARDAIVDCYGCEEAEVNVSHAFVLNKEETDVVGRAMGEWVCAAVRDWDAG